MFSLFTASQFGSEVQFSALVPFPSSCDNPQRRDFFQSESWQVSIAQLFEGSRGSVLLSLWVKKIEHRPPGRYVQVLFQLVRRFGLTCLFSSRLTWLTISRDGVLLLWRERLPSFRPCRQTLFQRIRRVFPENCYRFLIGSILEFCRLCLTVDLDSS